MLFDALMDHTMLTWSRMYSLYSRTREILRADIPGDFVECGVAGGGSVVLMATLVRLYTQRKRFVFACDSFIGMPEPGHQDSLCGTSGSQKAHAAETHWGAGTCCGPIDHVRNLASAFGSPVEIIAGNFSETLPSLKTSEIALLHADADWYDSTKIVVQELWPKVARGGVMQVDDFFYWHGCQKAVEECLPGIRYEPIDGNAVLFTKR